MEKFTDCFVKNRFEEGMLLSATDLSNLQNYIDGKLRLGYREFIGCGIVCGLVVKNASDSVNIGPGLAIDHKGREICVPKETAIRADSLVFGSIEDGACFLCLEYAEEPCGEAFVMRGGKLREPVHNRIRETFAFTAKRSRGDKDICIAKLAVERQNGSSRISLVQSPVDSFCFAPVLKNSLPGYKSGLLYIDFANMPHKDGIFKTGEIYHGLGPGKDVIIELSIKSRDQWRSCEVSGDPMLFDLPIQTAVKLYPESGTFIVAAKPLDQSTAPIYVRWRACAFNEGSGHA